MRPRCEKCKMVFNGYKCPCGWRAPKAQQPDTFYVSKEEKKGSVKVADEYLDLLCKMLGKRRPKLPENCES